MDPRIEEAVNRTLADLDKGVEVTMDAGFADRVVHRMAAAHGAGGYRPRGGAFYPAAIALLVVLTAAVWTWGRNQSGRGTATATDPAQVMAAEYGLGQAEYVTF